MRVVQFVQRQANDGHLSTRQLEERIEQIFRARSVQELDAVVADLPGSSVIALESALAGEAAKPTPENAWFLRLVISTIVIDAAGVALWAATGGGLIWLVLLFMLSAAAFAFRVTRRGRGGLFGGNATLLGGSRRRRRYGL